MGPKKENKKDPVKRDFAKGDKNPTIDDPLNSDSWRCAVVMAVERTSNDSFVLKKFMEEFSNGRRPEVGLINFNTFIIKLLNDFANGELHYKYSFLLNFSVVLKEAVEYTSKSIQIPVPLLVKVIKVFLFYLRDESLMRIEKKAAGPPDPILAMAERPANFSSVDTKKKEPPKKGDNAPKVRPPSLTKQDTKLLKRGEGVKEEQCIDDAPINGCFNLYVLLTGFYNPDVPLELIKAGIPLHGLLCIDTSLSGIKSDPSFTCIRHKRHITEPTSEEIHNFWDAFLKILWDPKASAYFKDTIFQVYVPQNLQCGKKKLHEFIYQEISYLMYDISDFQKQLNNYLHHTKLWDVEEKNGQRPDGSIAPEDLPNECISSAVMLQYIIDAICGNRQQLSTSSDSIDSPEPESNTYNNALPLSALGWFGSDTVDPVWSQQLNARGDFCLLNIYAKTKELDAFYELDFETYSQGSEKTYSQETTTNSTCYIPPRFCGENMKEALSVDAVFRSYWKKYDKNVGKTFDLDYCLYPLLMTKVFCPYQAFFPNPTSRSRNSLKKNSNFELIDNLNREMRKPHFTVTEGSRTILRALPYNLKDTSKDFFSPPELKIVSPEKLKVSSAPQFRLTPGFKVQASFTSEIFSPKIAQNVFENLTGFLDECLFSGTNNFDFLELLSQANLLDKKAKYWSSYNCIDHTYSILNDCIFLTLHNRMDGQNVHHETFNETLKTRVGLRDFYEYVLEDESDWFASQEESYQSQPVSKNHYSQTDTLGFSDSDFWLVNSIKYQERMKNGTGVVKDVPKINEKGINAETPNADRAGRRDANSSSELDAEPRHDFQGYDVSNMAVQFSGLKTVYYSNDCSLTVELIERLYGEQSLAIHIAVAGHTLHLHSFVCPEPHVLEPFTFHITYQNGIVLAFGRRLVEAFEEVEEKLHSIMPIKTRKNSSEVSPRLVKRQISKTVRDEEFVYDMAASLPNGLSVRTVRRLVKPCYIRQQYLVKTEEIARLENRRLFLPNGNVVKMMSDGAVEILKADTSTVTAHLSDLKKNDTGDLHFVSFELISAEGYAIEFEDGEMTSTKRLQVFQNTDMDTNQIFFRRRDGTNSMLQDDGSLCMQFKDGTKILSVAFEENEPESPRSQDEEEDPGETDPELDFVCVYMRFTVEHPDYATVMYDGQTQRWTIVLPFDSVITVDSNGQYLVNVDTHTELKVEADLIQINKYTGDRDLECVASADLSVFESKEGGVYCHMEDLTGKIFIVEGNSNCYILDEERASEDYDDPQEECSAEIESDISEFVASADLQTCASIRTEKSCKLSRLNKYFVVERDLTGFEILHVDDVRRTLSEKKKGSLVLTQSLPKIKNRVFVLITPEELKTSKKWKVESLLPNPKYIPDKTRKKTSSTYGFPPSWMHPFPKRRSKFQVPSPLSCRVFIETNKTDLSPEVGEIDHYFCEVDQGSGIRQSEILAEGVDSYLKRLTDNDQDLLRNIYTSLAESLVHHKNKSKPTNSEKLDKYLRMSRYYVEIQEHHKRCIRYNNIPNYFHHPAGMSWLILNDLLTKIKLYEEKSVAQVASERITESCHESHVALKSPSIFSSEEIEYDLSEREIQSFSELSYRSDLSAHTAPTVLRSGGVSRCKVRPERDATSAPVIKCHWEEQTLTDADFERAWSRECDFREEDVEMLGKRGREVEAMTLEDLMNLGLI